jgi:hypothetical protein
MPKRLTKQEQRNLYAALPNHRKNAVKRCQMRGDGLKKTMGEVGKVLGHIAKEVGPVVLKEIVVPLLKEKYLKSGSGTEPSGGSDSLTGTGTKPSGGGLRLAGQRGRPRGSGKKKHTKAKRKVGRPKKQK